MVSSTGRMRYALAVRLFIDALTCFMAFREGDISGKKPAVLELRSSFTVKPRKLKLSFAASTSLDVVMTVHVDLACCQY